MQKRTKNRLILTLLTIILVTLGICLILYNLNQNIIFFYPPSKITPEMSIRTIRIGGTVVPGSIENISPSEIKFILTDNISNIQIYFKGIPPALFRENQGIVAQGKLEESLFIATELLTKHDENYSPQEIRQ
jgi:cytochrome c-type biogenesis protein CcmE